MTSFLVHLSWKVKWAFLIGRCLSYICLSVNFYIFDFFSWTTGPILTTLGTDHPWLEGFQNNYSNEGGHPSPMGDNCKRVEIHWIFLKIFSRTTWPISIKLGTNHPWVKGIPNCSNEESGPLQRGDNHKDWVGSFENLLKNHWARRAHIYKKLFPIYLYIHIHIQTYI
jgi:hypothetical protein